MKNVNQTFNLRDNPLFFKLAKKINTSYFTLFYQKVPDFKSTVVVIVSKKNAPLASSRNKLKRQFKAAFNKLMKSNDNCIAVFRLKSAATKLDYQLIEESVKKSLYD